MSEPHGFWQQYKENLQEYQRQTPWRFLRLLVAFGMAMILAPCCYAVVAITGEPKAAMVVALVGIVGMFVAWRVLLWMFGRTPNQPLPQSYAPPGYGASQAPGTFPGPVSQSSFGPTPMGGLPPGKPGFDTPFPPAPGFVQPYIPGQPIMGASAGPVPPFANEAPRPRSGAGCAVAAVAVLGVVALSCCGGGVAVMAMLPNFKMQVGPGQPVAGPAGNPFGFPGPIPGALPNDPVPHKDPFDDMQRAQQKQFDDFIRENERQMREFDEQFRKQNEQAFGPEF